MAAVTRYDAISRIGRKSPWSKRTITIGTGCLRLAVISMVIRKQCIEIVHNAMRHYYFNILTTTFNFGGIPHEEIKKSMRLFARKSCRPFAKTQSSGFPVEQNWF